MAHVDVVVSTGYITDGRQFARVRHVDVVVDPHRPTGVKSPEQVRVLLDPRKVRARRVAVEAEGDDALVPAAQRGERVARGERLDRRGRRPRVDV